MRYADLPLSRLWSKALDTNPPLYYTLQKFWLLWFGRSEGALRSLSAVLGSGSILLVYGLGEALSSARLGLLVAFLLAISPLHIEYSQEARAYTLLAAGSTLAIVGLVRILSVPRTRNGAEIYLPVKEDGISVPPRFLPGART